MYYNFTVFESADKIHISSKYLRLLASSTVPVTVNVFDRLYLSLGHNCIFEPVNLSCEEGFPFYLHIFFFLNKSTKQINKTNQ